MTKNKRFGVITNWCVYEKIDGVEKWLTFDDIVTILNQLNEENVHLKKELMKENEQLKKELSKKMEECRRRGFE